MSPYTLDLPEGEGSLSTALFDGGDSYEPSQLTLPEVVEEVAPVKEETALDIYLREKAERDAIAQAAQAEQARRQQSLKDYVSSPDLESKLAGEDNIPEGVSLNQAGQELQENTVAAREAIKAAREQEYQKDFGWLGGQPLPGWTKYKEVNLADKWEDLTPENKAKAFEHYSNHARNYYGNYAGTDRNEVEAGLQNVLIGNTDLVDAQVGATQNKLDALGYGRGWKDSLVRGLDTATAGALPVKGNPGYESMSANLAGAKALTDAQGLIKTLQELNNYTEFLNPDGTVDIGKFNQAVEAAKENKPSSGDDLGSELDVQEYESLLARIGELGPDPYKKVTSLLETAKGYSKIGQLEMTKINKELAEGLSGKRILPSPLGAKDSQLSDSERISKVLSHPLDFATFTVGMALAQQADLLEENLIAGGVAALTGIPAIGIAGSAYAAGQQEATLVAADVIQDGLRKKGYDPTSIADWQRAYDEGIVSELASEAEKTGQAKGLTSAGVETGLENVFSAVLKKVPFIGPAAGGVRRAAGMAGKLASHGLAGFTSAATGEALGQVAAYGKTDLAEIVTEGLGDVAGTGGLAAYKGAVTTAANKLRGAKPNVVPNTTANTPVDSPAAPAPTVQDDRTAVEDLARSLQPTTPPTSNTENAQEGSTEVSPEAGDVTGGSQQGVAKSASQSAADILAAKGFSKDAYESASAIIDEQAYGSALESAAAMERLLGAEESIRQSAIGMDGLRQQLKQEANDSKISETIEGDEVLRRSMSDNPRVTQDIVALSRMIGSETSPVEQTKGKGMSVQESSRRNQGGFLDVGLAIDGLHEAAVQTWAKAKDFASWSADMLTQFGDKVKPVLKELWNKVTSLVRGVSQFVVAPVLPGRNAERGGVDLRAVLNKSIQDAGVNSPQLEAAAQGINLAYLNREQRQAFTDNITKIGKDFKESRKAGIDPTKSKAIFDNAMTALREAKAQSWAREFELLQKQYPESLASKTMADFQSGKEARGYVATNGAESEKAAVQAKQAAQSAKAKKTQDDRDKVQIENTKEAQRKAIATLDTPAYNGLSKENQGQVLKAMKYLLSQKPEGNSRTKNESIVAAINNLIEGNFLGAGKYASLQRVDEFMVDLGAMLKKYEGRIPFFDKNYLRQGLESVISGSETKGLFKKEARLRAVGFSHPELRQLWNKHFGNFLERAQTENSQIQQEMTDRLHEIGVKYGLAKKKILGKFRTGDKTLWNSKSNESLRRMQVAAMITTWQKDADDPLYDINSIITDLYNGIANEKKGPFLGAQGEANEAAFMKILRPALEDGMVVQAVDEKTGQTTFGVEATPEVWHDYVMSQLSENERDALNEYRKLAGQFEPGLKFVSEFYYGKEWKPWLNYMPRAAYGDQPEGRSTAPELTATTAAPLPDGTPLPTHGSVLHLRQRLGKGQFYGMDLASVLHSSLNTAAYETTTAGTRFAIDQALKSDKILPFFGDNKIRKERFKETLKSIHQAELHQGTGLKQPTNAASAFLYDAFNTISNSILSTTLARLHQFPSQYLSAFAGALTMMGPKTFNYFSQWKKAWDGPQGKKLYNDSFPDLLQRREQIDPFFDRSTVRSALDAMADISLNSGGDFSDSQKNLIYLARLKKAVTAGVEGVPKQLARLATNFPDYYAVQDIFPMLLQESLIRNGIISKIDEFAPSNIERIKSDERYANALAEAKTKVSDVMGNANRFSLRPDLFVFRGDQNPFIRSMFGLMQTVTQFAGDRFVDFKDLSYVNKSDPHAGKIRVDAGKRMASAVLQGIAFKYMAGWVAAKALSALAPAVGGVEGLDDEEKKINEKLTRIRGELFDENFRDQAIKELMQMLGGPFATNSVAGTAIDWVYGTAIGKALKEDMDKRKAQLKSAIAKEKNESKKADLQLELDGLIKYANILNMSANKDGFNLGVVPSKIMRVFQDKNLDGSEADEIQANYWKAGGLSKKPSPSKAGRLAVWAASFGSGDVDSAMKQADRARTLVGRARQVQLEEQQRNKGRKVDRINLGGLR